MKTPKNETPSMGFSEHPLSRGVFFLLFPSTRSVIKAEEVCRGNAIPVKVIPVPKQYSSECGMCLSVSGDAGERAMALLRENDISFSVQPIVPERKITFDLLKTVEYGGCSAKLPPDLLFKAIQGLPVITDPNLLVGIDTCDDAGVYRLTDDIALIETTDFFPPICSDPYEFGQIAAANALSDVFAMGGKVLTAMNLVMFPAQGIPFEVLGEILRGGQEKVTEAGGIIVGGHSIADEPPKYGLAVTGMVHPRKVISNARARVGETLILTKPIGTGVIVAGQRLGEISAERYQTALDSMKLLNRRGAEIMQAYGISCATDITGFGLLGHALNIARGSKVTLEINVKSLPVFPGTIELLDLGCIPGGAFKNLKYVEADCHFSSDLTYPEKMLTLDPQTSGGLLMAVPGDKVTEICDELRRSGYPYTASVGRVLSASGKHLSVIP